MASSTPAAAVVDGAVAVAVAKIAEAKAKSALNNRRRGVLSLLQRKTGVSKFLRKRRRSQRHLVPTTAVQAATADAKVAASIKRGTFATLAGDAIIQANFEVLLAGNEEIRRPPPESLLSCRGMSPRELMDRLRWHVGSRTRQPSGSYLPRTSS